MVNNFKIKPDLKKADMAAKLMAQQNRNTGAIFRFGLIIVEGTMSGKEESFEVLVKEVRFESFNSASVVKLIWKI